MLPGLRAIYDLAVDRGVPVMTFDSDVPNSKRFSFYGGDDVAMGRQVMAELELFPAVSENPNLAFDIDAPGPTRLVLRDNSGNEFDAAIP